MQSGSSRPRPSYPRAILKARADDLYADRGVVREAVHEFPVDRHDWPEVRDRGQVPSELEDYRPAGFDFRKPEYVLHCENGSTRGEAPFQVGLTVICYDAALGRAILVPMGSNACTEGLRGSAGSWSDGTRHTRVGGATKGPGCPRAFYRPFRVQRRITPQFELAVV
jgi:hypothetical protein